MKDIAKKFVDNVPLSKRETEILESKKDEINNLVKKESEEVSNKIDKQEPISQSDEDKNYDDVVNEIDSIGKKKGVYLYPSTGRHALDKLEEVEGQPGVYIEKINPKIGQQTWFSTLNDDVSKAPQEYTVQVVRRDDKSNEELWKQLSRDSDPNNSRDGDLFVVLHKDGKPIIKNGHYVFTSLWRPENLYPLNEDGTPKQFILAEKAVLENYLLHIQQPKLNLDKLSKNQKDFFKKLNVDPTKLGIMTAAFFHAKQEYTEWYRDLQENPKMLNVAAITKGHSLKSFNEDGELYWGSLNNIPGLKLKNGKVTSGTFQVSITGTLKVGEDTLNVNPGDTFYIDSSNRPHVIKPRLINEDEIRTVLYLLSLRSQPGPTESIKLSAPNPIDFGTKKYKNLPVFFNPEENQSNVTVIHSLIDFGNKKGKKGEIYFNRDSLLTEPIVVYTDFEGNTKNIKVSEIKNAVDNNDYSEIQDFYKFLEQKYFKINDRLLMNNNKFSKPSLVYTRDTSGQMQAELKWDQSKTYQEHLVDNIGTTTTISVKGKPEVIQRNLAFFKNPLPKNIEDEVQDTTETPITEDVVMKKAEIEKTREKITTTKTTSKEKFDFIDSLPEGTIFEYDEDQRLIIPKKRISKTGTESFDLIPQLWNDETNQWEDNPSSMTLLQKNSEGEYNTNASFPSAMMNSVSTNINTGERIISKPRIILPIVNSLDAPITEDVVMKTNSNKEEKKKDILNKLKNKKSLDDFKDEFADKILTTNDLLKHKIQNGEIKQNCK